MQLETNKLGPDFVLFIFFNNNSIFFFSFLRRKMVFLEVLKKCVNRK